MGGLVLAPGVDARRRALIGQLREARVARSLTQRALAVRLRVAEVTVVEWEACRDQPMAHNFVAWAAAVGCAPYLEDREGGTRARVPLPARGRIEVSVAFGVLVRALRVARLYACLSQQQVADALGVSCWTVRGWEVGRRVPRFARLLAWAEAVGCRVLLAGRTSPREGRDRA